MNAKSITIKAYIGSNNTTKELEVDTIISILNKNHDGFTLDYPVTGYWRGEAEQTAIRERFVTAAKLAARTSAILTPPTRWRGAAP
jgi:hypothetical protein